MGDKRLRGFVVLVGGLVVLAGGGMVPAVAEESPFSFSASQSFYRDDNLYRLPDGVDPSDGERSDFISTTRVGANYDGTYSRQGFHAGLSAGRTFYREHKNLNNTSLDGKLRWDWRVGDRWSGVLGYSYNENFVDFKETYGSRDKTKIIRRLGRATGSADYWWHPDWATGVSFSSVSNDYRDNARPRDEYDASEVNLNFTYRPSTGNRVVLSLRSEEGSYANRSKSNKYEIRDWEQRDLRLSGQWQLTGVTLLSGYIGYTQREYDPAPNRDFHGMTGRLALRWTPTAKAIVDLAWRREIGADQDAVSNYAVTHGWTLNPIWVITSKVRLGASLEYLKRDYGGDPGYGAWWVQTKDAYIRTYGLNLQYLPDPAVNVALGVQRETRDSKRDDYDYRSRSMWLSGSFNF